MYQHLLNRTTHNLKEILDRSQNPEVRESIEKILKRRKYLYAKTMVRVWKEEVIHCRSKGLEEDAIEAEKSYRKWTEFLKKEEV